MSKINRLFHYILDFLINLADSFYDIFDNKAFKSFVYILVILIITFILSRVLRKLIIKYFEASSKYLKIKIEATNYKFFLNAISFLLFIIALILIFLTIPQLKAFGITLIGGAGIFAAIIGFASREAFSNISSGIFIVIYKPFRVGDIIKLENEKIGEVEDITLWHTVIKDFENRRIVIPNSKISTEIILNANLSDKKICNFLEIGISYDSDVDKAIKIIQEESLNHPDLLDNRSKSDKENNVHPVMVKMISYEDFSIKLRAWIWAVDPKTAFFMKCDLLKSIKKRFDNEGIEIPFPYRTIVYKKDIEKEKENKNK